MLSSAAEGGESREQEERELHPHLVRPLMAQVTMLGARQDRAPIRGPGP